MRMIQELLNRSKLESIIGYLMDGTTSSDMVVNEFEKTIEESYDIFYDRLEKIYPETSRENNDLFDVTTDLVMKHDEIFLTMGIAIGFHLNNEFEKISETLKPLENDFGELN